MTELRQKAESGQVKQDGEVSHYGRQASRRREGKSFITFEDYAVAILDELEHPGHVGKRFGVAY